MTESSTTKKKSKKRRKNKVSGKVGGTSSDGSVADQQTMPKVHSVGMTH